MVTDTPTCPEDTETAARSGDQHGSATVGCRQGRRHRSTSTADLWTAMATETEIAIEDREVEEEEGQTWIPTFRVTAETMVPDTETTGLPVTAAVIAEMNAGTTVNGIAAHEVEAGLPYEIVTGTGTCTADSMAAGGTDMTVFKVEAGSRGEKGTGDTMAGGAIVADGTHIAAQCTNGRHDRRGKRSTGTGVQGREAYSR